MELVIDKRRYQTVGMRFRGIDIPQGAAIVKAYLQFQADDPTSDATSLTIAGEASDDATTFTSSSGNISSRLKTGASVDWSPPAWNTAGEAGLDQRTPDLSTIVQEIVDRPGWASGHALALIVNGTGERVAESYDGSPAGAPLLHVEYLPLSIDSNDPPMANDDSTTTSQNTSVTVNVTSNDTDPDDNLDPNTANTTCVTCVGPLSGSLLNNADGSFTYTPDLDFTGTDSFVYEVCDTDELCDTAIVNIVTTGGDCGECSDPGADDVLEQPSADGTIDGAGRFRVECDFSHRAQVDPIVSPFQQSHHMHDFFGNTITSDDPSYSRMLSGGSSCGFSPDTAAYWFPSLKAPDGSFVQPDRFLFYYRAKPVGYEYGTNYFPPDFKMIAGGVNAPDTAAYWTCKGESDTGYADRKTHIPDCTGVEEERLRAHVFFPSCWDGVNLDSPDHRSHVAYGLDDGKEVSTNPETCPASHPYKLPQLDLRVDYPITDGTGYVLSDGTEQPHADFWNTWQQAALEDLIDRCLRTGENCGGISD